MTHQVQFDVPRLKRLQHAYDAAVADHQVQFTFEGDEYLVAYAKYLIEYLQIRLGV